MGHGEARVAQRQSEWVSMQGGLGPPQHRGTKRGGREGGKRKQGGEGDGGESKKEEWKKARVEFVFICPRE